MKKWQVFLEKLKNCANNIETKELLKIIDKTKTDYQTILYKGETWLEFKTEDELTTLIFSPETEEIEITSIYKKETVEEITKLYYRIGFFSDIYVEKEMVVNHYNAVNGGYQLLIEAEKTKQRFTKSGFQKEKDIKEIYSPYFIYRSEEAKEFCNFLIPKGITKLGYIGITENIHFCENNYSYYISGLNDTIKANPYDTNNLVVFYKDGEEHIKCFPLYFNYDKSIIIKPFNQEEYLQLEGKFSSGYKDENLSLENRTYHDAYTFIRNRRLLVKTVMKNNTALNHTLKLYKKNY